MQYDADTTVGYLVSQVCAPRRRAMVSDELVRAEDVGQRRAADLLQVDGRADDDHVGAGGVDGRLQVPELLLRVAHCRQQHADVRVLLEGRLDLADGERPRVDELGGAELLGGHGAGAVLHLAVRERGAVLDHKDLLALDELRLVDGDRRGAHDDARRGIDRAHGVELGLDAGAVGGVDLVEHDHVGETDVDLAGVVHQAVAGTMRVGDGDVQVGLVEAEVVVAAVPEDDVGFLLGLAHDGLVVDAGVDHVAGDDVRLVLFHLFDGALVLGEVLDGGEALHALLDEVAVRHGAVSYTHLRAHETDSYLVC